MQIIASCLEGKESYNLWQGNPWSSKSLLDLYREIESRHQLGSINENVSTISLSQAEIDQRACWNHTLEDIVKRGRIFILANCPLQLTGCVIEGFLDFNPRSQHALTISLGMHTQKGEFSHRMSDGWGLTTTDDHIIGSDGTSKLYFMDPDTLKGPKRFLFL